MSNSIAEIVGGVLIVLVTYAITYRKYSRELKHVQAQISREEQAISIDLAETAVEVVEKTVEPLLKRIRILEADQTELHDMIDFLNEENEKKEVLIRQQAQTIGLQARKILYLEDTVGSKDFKLPGDAQ